jgi:DNA adenine methylase
MPPRAKNPNAPAADDPGWLHYCEPYAGGLAVLLANDPTGISECVNDLDGRLTNFWRVLRGVDSFHAFLGTVAATPFSETEWNDAAEHLDDPEPDSRAAAFFVRCRQSLAGRMNSFSPLTRSRCRKQMNEQAAAWLGAIEGLPAVHARLSRVVIRNKPALDVIRAEDGVRTLFYLDPPYLAETRTAPDVYALEMNEGDHEELLHLLDTIKGRFLLSGYRSKLYDSFAVPSKWNRHDFDLPNNAAGGAGKRRMTECVWCNFWEGD